MDRGEDTGRQITVCEEKQALARIGYDPLTSRTTDSPAAANNCASTAAYLGTGSKDRGGAMSAVNSNSSDREADAIRRAQRAHEPSMDEILASIRTIIAEEQNHDKARAPEKAAAPKSAPRATAPSGGPQIVYSKDDSAAPRPAQETIPLADAQPALDPDSSKGAARKQEAGAPPSPERHREPLLSTEADEAVASSFEALSASLAARSAEIAENMAREMLRPMLKDWLDQNLPDIVERLVRAEIQRVARGSR